MLEAHKRDNSNRVVATVIGLAMVAAVTLFSAFVAPAGAATGITVTQTPAADQSAACLPPLLALSNTHASTPTAFTLTITASAPLCSPLDVKAVVYAMPGNGIAWPQQLAEVSPFTISQAGTTTVTFAKGCDPVQFDVLTGDTPQTISPTGSWHGPLLFPLDTGTALQFFPDCNETTTTSTSTTTTTLPTSGSTTSVAGATTTTDAPASVLGNTTVVSTTTPADVLAATDTKDPNTLAFTGSTSTPIALIGGLMLVLGLGLVAVRRRFR